MGFVCRTFQKCGGDDGRVSVICITTPPVGLGRVGGKHSFRGDLLMVLHCARHCGSVCLVPERLHNTTRLFGTDLDCCSHPQLRRSMARSCQPNHRACRVSHLAGTFRDHLPYSHGLMAIRSIASIHSPRLAGAVATIAVTDELCAHVGGRSQERNRYRSAAGRRTPRSRTDLRSRFGAMGTETPSSMHDQPAKPEIALRGGRSQWRNRWDLNPRWAQHPHNFSRVAPSAARTRFRGRA